ncbi:3'-5' exoribonuclease [Actinomadura sp. K4S16]|uniref:3'-5' exoribonuclease n=1 Tax=Actinomadura sp. K4S16 TaxID=1316147 RepID=UPI0011EF1C5A|nr:3'-5' exoribonuclease [Actinomadura sp. K4S16]
MTKIYYDTEFHEQGPDSPIDLISIGMVTEHGSELYAVSSEFDQNAVRANPWLVENVWPSLPTYKHPKGVRCACGPGHLDRAHPDVRSRPQIARMVQRFITAVPDPVLVAYYGSYDHVVLAQLWGRMADMPEGVPMWTWDIRQEMHCLGVDELPRQEEGQHNALADARHNKVMDDYLTGVRLRRGL